MGLFYLSERQFTRTGTMLLVLLAVWIAPQHRVSAQFPGTCVTVENLLKGECCPIPVGFTEQCGGLGRGSCVDIEASLEDDYQPRYDFYEFDDRIAWPVNFFNRGCECEFPFWGADCSKCAWGYYGTECDQWTMLIRRNIKHLSAHERHQFFTYLNWAKGNQSDYVVATTTKAYMVGDDGMIAPAFVDVSIYDYMVWIHYYSNMRAIHQNNSADMMFNHHSSGFLPWHRAFMLYIERRLQELSGDYSFAMPYWDWTGAGHCDVCTDEYFGLPDKNGALSTSPYFSDWKILCGNSTAYDLTEWKICNPQQDTGVIVRLPGRDADIEDSLPRREHIGLTLTIPNYDTPFFDVYSNCSFRNTLGGNGNITDGNSMYVVLGQRYMHGQVHRYLGGVMNDVPCSVSDPIFFAHHGFVDRIFEKWFRRWKITLENYPTRGATIGHNRYSYMVPYFPVWRNADAFVRSTELGYDFEDVDEDGTSSDEVTLMPEDIDELGQKCRMQAPAVFED